MTAWAIPDTAHKHPSLYGALQRFSVLPIDLPPTSSRPRTAWHPFLRAQPKVPFRGRGADRQFSWARRSPAASRRSPSAGAPEFSPAPGTRGGAARLSSAASSVFLWSILPSRAPAAFSESSTALTGHLRESPNRWAWPGRAFSCAATFNNCYCLKIWNPHLRLIYRMKFQHWAWVYFPPAPGSRLSSPIHKKHRCERIFSTISGLRVNKNSMYQSRTHRLNCAGVAWIVLVLPTRSQGRPFRTAYWTRALHYWSMFWDCLIWICSWIARL